MEMISIIVVIIIAVVMLFVSGAGILREREERLAYDNFQTRVPGSVGEAAARNARGQRLRQKSIKKKQEEIDRMIERMKRAVVQAAPAPCRDLPATEYKKIYLGAALSGLIPRNETEH